MAKGLGISQKPKPFISPNKLGETVEMDNTTTPTEKQKEDLFEKENYDKCMNVVRKFIQSPFDKRRHVLNLLKDEIADLNNAEIKDLAIEMRGVFLEKHIKLTVAEVREKYGITKKPTAADFRKICEGEGITLVNDSTEPQTKVLEKYPCYFQTSKDGIFIAFDGNLKGKDLLHQQFQLLGNHFLHRDDLPPVNNFDEILAFDNVRRYEAIGFALQFVDTKPEVKNAEK